MKTNSLVLTSKAVDLISSLKANMAALKESKKAVLQQMAVRKQEEATLLIIDTSSSMNDTAGDGRKKIDTVRNLVSKIKGSRKIAFNSDISDLGTDNAIGCAGGSTNLSDAFAYIKNNNIHSGKKVILISDGYPDEPESAIKEAVKLGCPVYIIYIGDEGESGEDFMNRLARATKGTRHVISPIFKDFNRKLEGSVKMLLLA